MRSTKFSRAINAKMERSRLGVVTAVGSDSCTVLVGDGEVPAYLNDQVLASVVLGAVVTLRRIGDTYEVASTRTGTTGGGGLILGPELVPNGGFEYGSTDATSWFAYPWVGGDYVAVRDTTPGQAVAGAARMLATHSPGVDAPFGNVYSVSFRIDPGVAYQGAVQVKASAIEATLTVGLNVITAPTLSEVKPFGVGSMTTALATVAAPGSAYQLLTGTLTVPPGHRYAAVYLNSVSSTNATPVVSVSWDQASLRQRITS